MYRAIIIDDEKPVRIAVSKLGHWAAFQIEEPPVMAANGKEAIRTMRELHPHLAFVDMNMPVMNGSQFLQQAAAEFPDTRFIVISGYDEFSYAQQAIRCGAVDYLLKPIIEEDLNQAILHAMQSIDPSFAPLPQDRCSAPPDSDAVIDIIRDYIDKNYTENIKISMFADRYFFSREYLSKQFKSRYGCGIYEYVLQVRMERAKELLLDPDIKIQDIAQRIGYTDNNYFSKAVRNYYGISPSVFRQRT